MGSLSADLSTGLQKGTDTGIGLGSLDVAGVADLGVGLQKGLRAVVGVFDTGLQTGPDAVRIGLGSRNTGLQTGRPAVSIGLGSLNTGLQTGPSAVSTELVTGLQRGTEAGPIGLWLLRTCLQRGVVEVAPMGLWSLGIAPRKGIESEVWSGLGAFSTVGAVMQEGRSIAAAGCGRQLPRVAIGTLGATRERGNQVTGRGRPLPLVTSFVLGWA